MSIHAAKTSSDEGDLAIVMTQTSEEVTSFFLLPSRAFSPPN